MHPIIGIDAEAAAEQLGSSGPWRERLPHFRASFTPSAGDEIQVGEFFVPLDRASEVLAAVAARSAEFASALQVMEIRAIASDEMWLSPFQGRETLAVHATWVSDLDLVPAGARAARGRPGALRAPPALGQVLPGLRPRLGGEHLPGCLPVP